MPLQWANTQNNLGTALAAWGERESGIDRLEEAVRAYRDALLELTNERAPFWWAETRFNLALTLDHLPLVNRVPHPTLRWARLSRPCKAPFASSMRSTTGSRDPLDACWNG